MNTYKFSNVLYPVPIMLCCNVLKIHLLCSILCPRTKIVVKLYTVDGERFAGLNIRGFSAIKVFAEIFLHYLGHRQCISTHYLVQLKRGFCGTPENLESLVQRIFPHLRYATILHEQFITCSR